MIILSEEAAAKAALVSKQTKEQLIKNLNTLDSKVDALLKGIQDPTVKKYLELSNQLNSEITKLSGKIGSIEAYCDKMKMYIRKYKEI